MWSDLTVRHARLRRLHWKWPTKARWQKWAKGKYPNLVAQSVQQIIAEFCEAVDSAAALRKKGGDNAKFPWRKTKYRDITYTNQSATIRGGTLRLPNGKSGALNVPIHADIPGRLIGVPQVEALEGGEAPEPARLDHVLEGDVPGAAAARVVDAVVVVLRLYVAAGGVGPGAGRDVPPGAVDGAAAHAAVGAHVLPGLDDRHQLAAGLVLLYRPAVPPPLETSQAQSRACSCRPAYPVAAGLVKQKNASRRKSTWYRPRPRARLTPACGKRCPPAPRSSRRCASTRRAAWAPRRRPVPSERDPDPHAREGPAGLPRG